MSKIRKDFVFPARAEIAEAVRQELRRMPEPPNVITISGNGEPTLYPELEELILDLRKSRDDLAPKAKIVVLSNAAHLDSRKVITALNLADIRVVKLDAGNDKMVKMLNAPLVRRNLTQILEGIKKLDGCSVQSMFVTGRVDNTGAADIDEWLELVAMIKPNAIDLMTITRPPLDPAILAVDEDTLYTIAFKLKKRTTLEARVLGK